MKKVFLQIAVCFFLSIIGGVTFFACSQSLFVGLFIGSPVGNVCGIVLLRKLYFKDSKISIIGIILALTLCGIGARFFVFLLDYIAGSFIVYHLAQALLSLAGYYSYLKLKSMFVRQK